MASPGRKVLRSEEDLLHMQYLREKPLLEEIRQLRLERDRVVNRMISLELENQELLQRLKLLEAGRHGVRSRKRTKSKGSTERKKKP